MVVKKVTRSPTKGKRSKHVAKDAKRIVPSRWACDFALRVMERRMAEDSFDFVGANHSQWPEEAKKRIEEFDYFAAVGQLLLNRYSEVTGNEHQTSSLSFREDLAPYFA